MRYAWPLCGQPVRGIAPQGLAMRRVFMPIALPWAAICGMICLHADDGGSLDQSSEQPMTFPRHGFSLLPSAALRPAVAS